MLEISVDGHFDAAHYLPNYQGKCCNMHGHTWHVTTTVTAPATLITADAPLLLDFAELRRLLDTTLERYDHRVLNEVMRITPSAETLAIEIHEYLSDWIDTIWDHDVPCRLRVTVAESPYARATYSPESE